MFKGIMNLGNNFRIFVALGVVFIITRHGVYGKECAGSNSGPNYVLFDSRSQAFQDQFKDCSVVRGNIEIISFYEQINSNFLDSIEEVKGYILIKDTNLTHLSMRNLKLIRGKYLYDGRSLDIEDNQLLERILFPSLREISRGNVHMENNPKLCFVETIEWKDFMHDSSSGTHFKSLGTECPQCGSNCDKCWSEGACQNVRREYCSSTCDLGCQKEDKLCCDSKVCAGGCSQARRNCVTCRRFGNNGRCEDLCPSFYVYNQHTGNNDLNPNGRYHYENRCLKECPNGTVPKISKDGPGSCEFACSGRMTEGTCGECLRGSTCDKVCSETSINASSIVSLRNCSVIAGPVKILTGMISNEEASIVPRLDEIFSTVKKVTDAVVIQGMHDQFVDLSSLKNLEVIQGFREDSKKSLLISHTSLRSLKLWSLESILNGDLWVSDNDQLESLDLISLKLVDGSVIIKNNKNLCFVEKYTFENITWQGRIIVERNKNSQLCKQEGKVCHEECLGGCWGSGNKQCRSCRNFDFQGECISSCDRIPDLYESGRTCKKCHEECLTGCTGDGPFNCTRCRNAEDEGRCVNACPDDKYLNSVTGTCQPCHRMCRGGCTGASVTFGPGGCNGCELLLNTSRECLDSTSFNCSVTRYKKLEDFNVSSPKGNKSIRIEVCYDCPPLCRTCTGSHACECLYVEYKGGCLDSCPPRHYKDHKNKCHMCHEECDECYESSPYTCHTCKNVRIYLDEVNNVTFFEETLLIQNWPSQIVNQSELFVCNSTCPPHASLKREMEIDGIMQRKCVRDDQRSQTNQKIMIGSVVLGVIGVISAVFVIFAIWKRQKAKAAEDETKMQAQIEGINAYELLTPSKVRPESMNCLRLIKESELDQDEEIGRGNFGVVYRGIWRPEGEKVRVAVAIKILTEESSSAQHKELLEEARVMASVSHPCCIRILAVCLSRQMMLITPLVAHGSVLEYLEKKTSSIGSHTMLKWAAQIARAGILFIIEF